MIRYLLFLPFLFSTNLLKGQTDTVAAKIAKLAHKHVDVLAKFPQGDFKNYIATNVQESHNIEYSIKGNMVLVMTIGADGSISHVTVLKSLAPKIDADVVRVINASPKWQPAVLSGQKVSMDMVLNIDMAITGYKKAVALKPFIANIPKPIFAAAKPLVNKKPIIITTKKPEPSVVKKAASIGINKPAPVIAKKVTLPPLTKQDPVVVKKSLSPIVKKTVAVVTKKAEPLVIKKPAPVVAKKVEPPVVKKIVPVVAKKVTHPVVLKTTPAPIVKKPVQIVTKKIELPVIKKPEPVTPKKAAPRVMVKTTIPPVVKKPAQVITKKVEPPMVKKPVPIIAKKIEPPVVKKVTIPVGAKKTAPMVVTKPAPVIAKKTEIVSNKKPDVKEAAVTTKPTTPVKRPKRVVMKQDLFNPQSNNAEFPGGLSEFFKYLGASIIYPPGSKKAGVQGKVFITFTVDEDGTVDDVEAISSPADDLSQEAIRVLLASPKWKPASQNGRNVPVSYTIPIKFTLTDKANN